MQNRSTRPVGARYPRVRIDALTDGIFAVAMTLLVLDIHLPEDFLPRNSVEMLSALMALWPKFLAYGMSFMILGSRWLSQLRWRTRAEQVDGHYIGWWMFYLLMITCVPFSTVLVGRYHVWPPALWVYAGNTAAIALASARLDQLTPEPEDPAALQRRRTGQTLLLLSTVLCVLLSLLAPRHALWGLLINLAEPRVSRWTRRRA